MGAMIGLMAGVELELLGFVLAARGVDRVGRHFVGWFGKFPTERMKWLN